LHIFRLAEQLLESGHPPIPVREGGIVRYEILPLPARTIPLPGQPPIRRGEPVIGLHFDNRMLAELAATLPDTQQLTWRLIRSGSADLRRLADLARSGTFPDGVRVLWAETVIYRALRRYGFTTRAAPRTLRTPFARLFMLGMLATYGHPEHLPQGRTLQHLQLGEAWMTLDDLLERYPPKIARGPVSVAQAANA
jgi:hypothetical protein